jgi:sugar lactone lactonase YvrE
VDVTPPDAGPDQWVEGDSATLAANTPLVGTGVWSVLAGSGTVTDPTDPDSTVTGLSVGINAFVWSISYSGGPAEHDVVAITREGGLVGRDAPCAGTGAYGYSGDGGSALDASFYTLRGIAVDRSGNVYLSDDMRIRKIDGQSGIITTIAGSSNGGFSGDVGSAVDALLNVPTGLAADWAGNLFIADRNNNRIRRIDSQTGIITTVAGTGSSGIGGNEGDGGPAVNAALDNPEDVAVDEQGNLYIADKRNDRIRKVDAATGIITTVAGSGAYGGDEDYAGDGGPATEAKLSSPEGVAVDSQGNFYIADTGNGVVRKVDAATGVISTVMTLANANGVTVDLAGNVYAAANCGILKLDPFGTLTTIQSQCLGQMDIASDAAGNLYVTESSRQVEKITFAPAIPPVITITAPADGFRANYEDGPIAFDFTATDAEDGDLTSSVVWESSIDGIVQSPATLSVGTHILTARVTDSDGLTTSESITCIVASTADQYAIRGGVDAYYVDNNNDGQFTQVIIGSDLAVAARRITFINSYYTKRVNLEIELSALRASGQHVSRAAIQLNASAFGAYPFQIGIYGYAADGVAELADAQSGDPIIGSIQADHTGSYEADITDYINQLIDSGAQWLGLSLRSANESGTDGIDEHLDFKGFDYSNSLFPGAALLVSYAEPPVISISSPADGAVVSEDDGPMAFAATADDPEDGDISAAVQWRSRLDGAFTPPAALSVGTHTVTAAVTDSSGLTSDTSVTVTVEAHVNEPPEVSITAPADGAVLNVDDGPVAFAAAATDLEDGDISAAVQWSSSLDGAFTPPAALSVGAHTVTASVSDSQGLTADASITVTVEPHVNVAPAITIAAPGDGAVFNEDDGAIAFAATAADPEDGDISTGIQWSSSLDGAFTPPAALSVGTHTVTATVTDSGGLTTVSTTTVIVGAHVNLAPKVTISAPLDGDTVYRNNRPVDFAAIAADPEQGDMGSSVQWSSSLDGAFAPPAVLSAGTHVITARVTDTQGLTGSDAITLHVEDSDNIVLGYEQFIETGTVANVGTQNWTTVHLAGAYASMVVVCTPVYDNTAPPMVTRIQNAAGGSFQLKLDRADGLTEEVAGIDVNYVVVQEGIYTEAEHGITMEAVRMVSTATDGKGSWNGQPQTYANSYLQPVVIGQVMTTNDPAFSVFWSCGASKGGPPSASALKVGKHVGEDPRTYRAEEALGYLVIESSSGTIGSLKYSAAVGADIVTGLPKGTNPGIGYGFTGVTQPTCAILSQTAMDGGDGGWPILYGADPISAGALSLVIDEDKMSDAERNHTTEQVAYLVFGQ